MQLGAYSHSDYNRMIAEAVRERRFGDSFSLVMQRNDAKWRERGYQHKLDLGQWQRIEEVFTKELLKERRNVSDQGQGLIFIVGMPRAGKTTLENILAQIKGVVAGGELPFISDQFGKVQDPNGQAWDYPDYVPFLPVDIWPHFAQNYTAPMREYYDDADFVIDTMPPTFRYLGLLKIMLPKAKVLHMVRTPLDQCIDMFSKNFQHSFYDYTNNLDAMAAMYVAYRRLMEHWRSVLGDWMLDVSFDQLVKKPKKEIKKVIAFCGIESDLSPQALTQPHKDMLAEIDHACGVLKNYYPYMSDFEKSLGKYVRV